MADENLSMPQDQDHNEELEIAMRDVAGDGACHGGQEQADQPDKSCCQTWIPWAQANRKGRSQKTLSTLT